MTAGSRRLAHQLFFALAATITLVSFFYAEEDWRGARALAAARRDLQARGESLDFSTFVPPPIPDDRNLAMAPLFVQELRYEVDPATRQLVLGRSDANPPNETQKLFRALRDFDALTTNHATPKPRGLWTSAHSIDLAAWQHYFLGDTHFPQPREPQAPPAGVLLALTRFAPLLDDLARAAATRPLTRFPVNYTKKPSWGINIPHYFDIRLLTAVLRLRAVASLAAGETGAAGQDIDLMLRLRQATAYDPFLIAGIVDCIDIRALLQPVWEGLAARKWSAGELDHLRASLAAIETLPGYLKGMRGSERSLLIDWSEQLQHWSAAVEFAQSAMMMSANARHPLFLRNIYWRLLPFWPHGWYQQNAVLTCHLLQTYLIDAANPSHHRVDLARNRGFAPAVDALAMRPSTFMASLLLPDFSGVLRNFARTQVSVDQAVIGCALEHYFIDHHAYPSALDALLPAYLDRVPPDVIDGAPMRYRLTVNGRYQLYSVGWNGRDDGGAIAWAPERNGAFPGPQDNDGDWVWQYSPAEPPFTALSRP